MMKTFPLRGFTGAAAAAAISLLTVPAQAIVQTVIEAGSDWRYLDTGQLPPRLGNVNWNEDNYNAAAAGSPWKLGRAVFGYGDNIPYGTEVSFGPNASQKYVTTYFWKAFQLPQGASFPSTFNQLQIGLVRDDGAVVYINGQEVRRDNMPAAPAQITNDTLATGVTDGVSESRVFETNHAADMLRPFPQMNYIAVELHQVSPSSSDIRFDLFMNISEAAPCYGDARPGIRTGFNYDGQTAGDDTVRHRREPLFEPSPPDYTFDNQDTEMNWKHTTPAEGASGVIDTEVVEGTALPDPAMFVFGGTFTWESEAIDIRNYRNVAVQFDAQSSAATGTNWNSNDKLQVILRTSADGVAYQDVPWMNITTGAGATTWTSLVAEDAQKRAIVPSSSTTPPSTWTAVSFNDSTWPSGTKGAGYEGSPGSSTDYTEFIDPNFNFRTQMHNQSGKTVIYMRAKFPAVANLSTFSSMRLRVRVDDGFVAFLNGQEIARKNVNGTPTFNSTATTDNPDTSAINWEDFDVSAHRTKLSSTGENVLAIYGMNVSSGSSDMLIWPVLEIGKPGPPPAVSLQGMDDDDSSTYQHFDSKNAAVNGRPLIPDSAQSLRIKIVATAQTFDKAIYFDNVKVTGDATVPDSFDSYMAMLMPNGQFTAEQRQARADADGDTLPNLIEYAFCTDPKVANLRSNGGATGLQIEPEVWIDQQGYVFCRFRIPTGNVTGGVAEGYDIGDLNIRPQISFGSFDPDDGWNDGITGVNYFTQISLVEANDGTGCAVVTVRTIDRLVRTNRTLYVRVRVGVRFPSYLKGRNVDAGCTL